MFDTTFLRLLYGQAGGEGQLQTLAGLLYGVDSSDTPGGVTLTDDSVIPSYLDADTDAKKKLFRDRLEAEGPVQKDTFTTFDLLGNLNPTETTQVNIGQALIDARSRGERHFVKVTIQSRLQSSTGTGATASVNITDSAGDSLIGGAKQISVTSHSDSHEIVYYFPLPATGTLFTITYGFGLGDIIELQRKESSIFALNYDVIPDLLMRTDLSNSEKETIRNNLGAGAAAGNGTNVTFASRKVWHVQRIFAGASNNAQLGLEVNQSAQIAITPQGSSSGGFYLITRIADDGSGNPQWTNSKYRDLNRNDLIILVDDAGQELEFHYWNGTALHQVYSEQSGIHWLWELSDGNPMTEGNATFVPIFHVPNIINYSSAGLAMNGGDDVESNLTSAIEVRAATGHFFGAYVRVSATTTNDDGRPTWSPFLTLGAVNQPVGNATRDDTGLGMSIIPTYHRNNGNGDIRVAYATAGTGFVDGTAATDLWEPSSSQPVPLVNWEIMALIENNRLRVITRYPVEGAGMHHVEAINTGISDWVREGSRNFFTALQYATAYTINRLAFGDPQALIDRYDFEP